MTLIGHLKHTERDPRVFLINNYHIRTSPETRVDFCGLPRGLGCRKLR